MTSNQNFVEALATGEVVLRKAWVNEKSTKNQMSLQFFQDIEIPAEDNPNVLVAIAQGLGERVGRNYVSHVFSFDLEVAMAKGVAAINYAEEEGEEVLTASKIFGMDVCIKVVENTTKNPNNPNQQPKLNPSTNEFLTYNGQLIYRHTSLVPGTSATHTFLASNGTVSADDAKKLASTENISTESVVEKVEQETV